MRLYSDLQDSAGRRYFFNLESAPGGISPATAIITLFGYQGSIQELTEVFRTPATAILTFNGLGPSSELILLPAQAQLSFQGFAPALLGSLTITNALPPDYTDLPDNAPTVLTEMTVSPARALFTIASLTHAVNQGGNIRIIEPPVGVLSFSGYAANFPIQADVGALQIVGLSPDMFTEITITPETGAVSVSGLEALLQTPFAWVDDAPAQTATWIDDPRA